MSNDELVQSSLSYRSWQGMTGDWTLGSHGISKCQSILRWKVCSRIVRAINHARKKKSGGTAMRSVFLLQLESRNHSCFLGKLVIGKAPIERKVDSASH